MVGIQRQKDIRGLFLWYPALVTVAFQEVYLGGRTPKRPFRSGWMLVGTRYVADINDYPIYEHMPELHLPVMIYHGTSDELAPIVYSERAVQTLPDAQIMKIPGAGHMLSSHAGSIERDMIDKISKRR